ncbi:hypothetical protein Glove_104g14 [Diversispora epigaea]|uniref:Protein kinase domain-containing protein n=1 Tax=Diversispora epigaea TaxID=1348612 RepID=A0A397JC29_9GLOM|nr:hypothetical protein Glove_104g14 [Diversispora epigaea]
MDNANFPDHVMHHINVAVVAMILSKTYGYGFISTVDDFKSNPRRGTRERNVKDYTRYKDEMSEEMWTMTEKLHNVLIQCLGTENDVLNFINWFFDGVRKTFDTTTASTTSSQTSLNNHYQNNYNFISTHHVPENLKFSQTCFQCKRKYTGPKWCRSCEAYLFESNFNTWTSGNQELDKLIRQTQLESTSSDDFLKFIPFNQFTQLKEIGRGGFSTVFSARWQVNRLNGTLAQWVTNMEHQIILDYVKSHNVLFNESNWNAVVNEFTKKMKLIYESRKILKCKPLEESEADSIKSSKNNSLKINRRNSILKVKGLFRSLSLSRSRKRFSSSSFLSKVSSSGSQTFSPVQKITHVPSTTSPFNDSEQTIVALRRLDNSSNLSSEFINELRLCFAAQKNEKFAQIYGITQDPESKDYYLIMEYANNGNINRYLRHNYTTIDWWQRISILGDLVKSLNELHERNFVHRNLHSGNVLRHFDQPSGTGIIKRAKIMLTDVGLGFPAGIGSKVVDDITTTTTTNTITSEEHQKHKVYGVLPYIAPEVLHGEKYTKAADIYSLGILMWEITSGQRPYLDRPYDRKLAVNICEGLRPEIIAGTPDVYRELMEMCWDANPSKRPDIYRIIKITNNWHRAPTTQLQSNNLSNSSIGNPNSINNSFEMFTTSRVKSFEIFAEAEKLRRQLSINGGNMSRSSVIGGGTDESGMSGNESGNNIILPSISSERLRKAPPESHMVSRQLNFEDLPKPRNAEKSPNSSRTEKKEETEVPEIVISQATHQGSPSLDSAVGMPPIKEDI